ncbi:DNA-binding transcriptional LysR family regulator [Amorphus suaedae]
MIGHRPNFSMDVLRSFVTGVDLGSFAKAGERLGRSPSALSLQLRKLEEQSGQVLFLKQGRGLALTEAGAVLLDYARRILDLNDEAAARLDDLGAAIEGRVRVGVPEDFAESWLPALLGRFARAHPKARVELRVDRGARLMEGCADGGLDLALVWHAPERAPALVVAARPIVWIAADGYAVEAGRELPLVAFDAPCAFRSAALAALEREGIGWRQAVMSPSVAGLWAAARAGLGVVARTTDGMPAGLAVLPQSAPLPALGDVALCLHEGRDALAPPALALRALLVEALSA